VGAAGSVNGCFYSANAAVGNFDDDPQLEIVIAEPSEFAGRDSGTGTWDNTGIIHLFNTDGTEVSGWPKYTQGITLSSPVVADVNGDGSEDLIVGHMYLGSSYEPALGGVYVYDRSGNVLSAGRNSSGRVSGRRRR